MGGLRIARHGLGRPLAGGAPAAVRGCRRCRTGRPSQGSPRRPASRRIQTCSSRAQEAHSLFLLLHGHVRAEKTTPDGKQIVVRYVSAGEVFGVAQAIGLKHYPATAVAAVDSVVAGLAVRPHGRGSWRSIRRWPPTRCRRSAQRLQEAHTRVIEMTTEEVERRIAHALLRLAQAGRPQGRKPASRSISRSAARTWPR